MRDLALEKALAALAADAGRALRALIEAGEEVPYEVSAGDGTALAQYTPLTERFVVSHSAEIRSLGAYPEAREAIARAQVAAGYLEEVGVPVPAGADERDQRALLVFLCRLWEGSTDFAIEGDDLRECLGEIVSADEPVGGEVELVVPLIGLRLPTSRIELAGVELVRSDLIEVPDEARRGERRPNGTWEPTYLAATRIQAERSAEAEASAPAVLGRIVTTLRLFKTGGIGLGPHAWVRARGDRWRRISTGAARPRPGGLVVEETELGALADLALALENQPEPPISVARALSRFEAGMERGSPLDALNDHLLALRYLLEGAGPARTPLPRRVAALAARGTGRDAVGADVEAALRVERELWSGERSSEEPARVAAAIEDVARLILRRALTGELGSDLRSTADEALLSDGLSGGGGQADVLESSDWDTGEIEPEGEPVTDEIETYGEGAPIGFVAEPDTAEIEPASPFAERRLDQEQDELEREAPIFEAEAEQPLHEPRPEPGQISVARMSPLPEPGMLARNEAPRKMDVLPEPRAENRARDTDAGEHQEPERRDLDVPSWLDEEDKPPTLDFPERGPAMRLLDHRQEEKAAVNDRVAHLFPRPETDWQLPNRLER